MPSVIRSCAGGVFMALFRMILLSLLCGAFCRREPSFGSARHLFLDYYQPRFWHARVAADDSNLSGRVERRAGGQINYSDITNIQSPTLASRSIPSQPRATGWTNAAFVNPVTGAFIFHDVNQGLGVVGYQGGLHSLALSCRSPLTVVTDHWRQPLTSVADQFNALNNGSPYAGFPTAGFWTASFPSLGFGGS